MMEPKQRYKGIQGEVELQLLRPAGVLSAVISGHLDRSLGTAIVEQTAKLFGESSRLSIFLDFSMMTGFDSSVRDMMRRFKRQYGKRMIVHILTGTQIHAMFIAVGRLTLGDTLVGHTERSVFQEALRQAIQGQNSK